MTRHHASPRPYPVAVMMAVAGIGHCAATPAPADLSRYCRCC